MIINNKYLNKRPSYKLPCNTKVCVYYKNSIARCLNFKEDIAINGRYDFKVLEEKHPTNLQVLISSDDVKLLEYLKGYNFNNIKSNGHISSGHGLTKYAVSKIISDYYKGLEDDNK